MPSPTPGGRPWPGLAGGAPAPAPPPSPGRPWPGLQGGGPVTINPAAPTSEPVGGSSNPSGLELPPGLVTQPGLFPQPGNIPGSPIYHGMVAHPTAGAHDKQMAMLPYDPTFRANNPTPSFGTLGMVSGVRG
jgi:hypothetical protein